MNCVSYSLTSFHPELPLAAQTCIPLYSFTPPLPPPPLPSPLLFLLLPLLPPLLLLLLLLFLILFVDSTADTSNSPSSPASSSSSSHSNSPPSPPTVNAPAGARLVALSNASKLLPADCSPPVLSSLRSMGEYGSSNSAFVEHNCQHSRRTIFFCKQP